MLSDYDKKYMTEDEQQYVTNVTDAVAKGYLKPEEGNASAEKVRNKYNYSGGADGSQHIELNKMAENSKSPTPKNEGSTSEPKQQTTTMPEGFNYKNSSEYTQKWDDWLDNLMSDYMNRKGFSYNHTTDPLFAAYREQYERGGNKAMNDTISTVSARTGGIPSSYATIAGQQAYGEYMDALNDKIPELEQLAYEKYLNEQNMKLNDINLVASMGDRAYNRWSDDRNFEYGLYSDNWNRQYTLARDAIEDARWDTQWKHTLDREAIYDARYDDETAFSRNYTSQENAKGRIADMIINGGLTATEVMEQVPGLFAASGLTELDLVGYEKQRIEKDEEEQYGKDQITKEAAQEELLMMLGNGASADDILTWGSYLVEDAGWSELLIRTLADSDVKQNTPQTTSSRGSSTGGRDESVNSGNMDYAGLFAAAKASGNPKSWLSQKANYSKYGFSSSSNLYEDYQRWEGEMSVLPTGIDKGEGTDYYEIISYLKANNSSLNPENYPLSESEFEWAKAKDSESPLPGTKLSFSGFSNYQDYLDWWLEYYGI